MAERVQLIGSMPGLDEARSIAEFLFKQQMFAAEQARAAEQMQMQREQMRMQQELQRAKLEQTKAEQGEKNKLMREYRQAQMDKMRQSEREKESEANASKRFASTVEQLMKRTQPMIAPETASNLGQTGTDVAKALMQMGGFPGFPMLDSSLGLNEMQAATEAQMATPVPQAPTQQEIMLAAMKSGVKPGSADDIVKAFGFDSTGTGSGSGKFQILATDPARQLVYGRENGQDVVKSMVTGETLPMGQTPSQMPTVPADVASKLNEMGLPVTGKNMEMLRKAEQKQREEEQKRVQKQQEEEQKRTEAKNKDVKKMLDTFSKDPIVSDYDAVAVGTDNLNSLRDSIANEVEAAKKERRPINVAALQRLAGYAISKLSDTRTGVRDAELSAALNNAAGYWTQMQSSLDNLRNDTANYTLASTSIGALDQAVKALRAGLGVRFKTIKSIEDQYTNLLQGVYPDGDAVKMFSDALRARNREQYFTDKPPAAPASGTKPLKYGDYF